MHSTDPIADLLTRIRNASTAKHSTVDIPASNIKKGIVKILQDEGYVKGYQVIEDDKQGVIRVTLKYVDNMSAIQGLRRVSKPGLRIYSNSKDMPQVLRGLGTAIVSTSQGIMTDRDARKQNVGGEVLAFIW
jgi:Ribosomal protein S8